MITLPSNVQWITPDLAVAVIPGDSVQYDNGQVWEVRWVCPTCSGDPYPCWTCHNRSFLSARAVIQVIPATADWEMYDDTERVTVDAEQGHAILHLEAVDPVVLPLDPLPVPGRDWVLVIRKAES